MKMRKKDFLAERQEIKMMLGQNKQELDDHRSQLEVFERAFGNLTTSTDPCIGELLHERIVLETKKVRKLEQIIKSLQEDLDGKYSLKPATL